MGALDLYLKDLQKKLGLGDEDPNPTISQRSSYLHQPEAAEQDKRERQVQEAMLTQPVKRLPAIQMEPEAAPVSPDWYKQTGRAPQKGPPGPTHEDDILSQLPGNWMYDQGVYQELNGDKAPKQMLTEDDALDYLDFLSDSGPSYGVTVGEPQMPSRYDVDVGEPQIHNPAFAAMKRRRR